MTSIHDNFTHALPFSQLFVFQKFSIVPVFYELLSEFAVLPGSHYYHIPFFEG